MRILLLGKSGLLGQALEKTLSGLYEISAPNHKECDVTDSKMLEKRVAEAKPDIIINGTGYTAVDGSKHIKKKHLN